MTTTMIQTVPQTASITAKPAMPSPVQNFGQYLAARRKQIASVLPKHLTPERVCRVAMTAFTKTPALAQCEMASVYQAVQQAAELGLEPGGALGQCYLLPYGRTCQLIVSYKGLIELARRSGEIESIEARVVHENDEYDVSFGLHSDIHHKPCLDGDPGQMVMVYAVARLKGGMVQFEVMTRADVDAIRRRSRSGNSGPWVTDYDEMARKTVVRRLCKYLPISAEKLAMAFEAEDSDIQLPTIPAAPQQPSGAPEDAAQQPEVSAPQAEAAPDPADAGSAADAQAAAALPQQTPVPPEAETAPAPRRSSRSARLADKLAGKQRPEQSSELF